MFFASILVAPILAGLIAGLITGNRRVSLALGGICVALGLAGAVVTAVDADVTDRPAAIAFALVAGSVAGLLAYAGWYVGREGRRRTLSRAAS
jgi:hypothetical protein